MRSVRGGERVTQKSPARFPPGLAAQSFHVTLSCMSRVTKSSRIFRLRNFCSLRGFKLRRLAIELRDFAAPFVLNFKVVFYPREGRVQCEHASGGARASWRLRSWQGS